MGEGAGGLRMGVTKCVPKIACAISSAGSSVESIYTGLSTRTHTPARHAFMHIMQLLFAKWLLKTHTTAPKEEIILKQK